MSRSARGFCHGLRGAVRTSRNVLGSALSSEDLANLQKECLHGERLRKKGARGRDATALEFWGRIAGYVQHAELRIPPRNVVGEFTTAHSRHDDIGDQEIDHPAVAVCDRLRLLAGPRLKHGVAVLPENLSDQVSRLASLK